MTHDEALKWAKYGKDAMWRILDSGMYKIMIKDL